MGRSCALILALCAVSPVPVAGAVEQRLASVERLLTDSTGIEQIESSGDDGAMALLERARTLLGDARAAHAAGDDVTAARRLDEASRTMFEAVRLAGTPTAIAEKRRADFTRRKESVDALIDALERIAAEKGRADAVAPAVAGIREMAGRAEDLREADRLEEGRAVLEAAHEVAAAEVETLRSGDTLIRTLTFDSKEEEYAYELDRNDTHEMLLRVLVEERSGSAALNAMASRFLEQARELRARAEREASDRRYEAAVETLESSTDQLIRALRSSGVYIPG